MSRCFVAEDEAGKERKRRHIGGYDAVFVTLPADAASRSNVADQPENALEDSSVWTCHRFDKRDAIILFCMGAWSSGGYFSLLGFVSSGDCVKRYFFQGG